MTGAVLAFRTFAGRRPSLPLWALAALGALVLHLTCIGVVVAYLQSADDDDDLGAPAMEIGLDLAAPHEEATDLPPGPVADDSAASPAVVEQKANLEKSELPRDTPTETDDPDRLVSPNATKQPTEKDPEMKTVETMPSAESVASEAAAPPSSDVIQEAPRSTAPSQGVGQSLQRVQATWQKQLVAHLDKHKRYPEGQSPHNIQILVSFTLDRTGHVLAESVVKSSGEPAFDEAALAMIRRSDPVPSPPPLVADEGLTFTVPILFRVKNK